jgi:hypothetical protein
VLTLCRRRPHPPPPQIKAYFFESDTFEETFMGWAVAHCDIIDLSTEENKLECVGPAPPLQCALRFERRAVLSLQVHTAAQRVLGVL